MTPVFDSNKSNDNINKSKTAKNDPKGSLNASLLLLILERRYATTTTGIDKYENTCNTETIAIALFHPEKIIINAQLAIILTIIEPLGIWYLG